MKESESHQWSSVFFEEETLTFLITAYDFFTISFLLINIFDYSVADLFGEKNATFIFGRDDDKADQFVSAGVYVILLLTLKQRWVEEHWDNWFKNSFVKEFYTCAKKNLLKFKILIYFNNVWIFLKPFYFKFLNLCNLILSPWYNHKPYKYS